MEDRYLQLPPPKSTGREYFGAAYTNKLLALGRRHGATPNDLIRTATIFTALSIAEALRDFVLPKIRISQLIVSGGGAHNPLLMAQLTALLAAPTGARSILPSWQSASRKCAIEVVPSAHFAVPTDAKEAMAFALLAYETFHQRPSNIPTATGASGPAILGKISYAPPR
jgi:anhydro-N-acetylmuramic acid kinase